MRGLLAQMFAAALLVQASCHAPDTRRVAAAPAPTPETTAPSTSTAPKTNHATREHAEATASGYLSDPKGELSRFFAALRKAEHKASDGRVLVAQFGDSHTAGDGFTKQLRRRLQSRFGDAGRGFLLPGKPMHHYYQRDARYGSRGKWKCERGWRGSAEGPFGLGAVRVHAKRKSASLYVESCHHCPVGSEVDSFEIFYAKAPKGGRLRYRIDDGPWKRLATRTKGSDPETAYHRIKVESSRHRLTLRPVGDGPVNLYGVALERNKPGVIVDSLGVVGARAKHLENLDWDVIGKQLAHRDPRLVTLQYGTNEAYIENLSPADIEKRYIELIARIRKAVPAAAILIIGPPDVGMRELPYRECKKWWRKRAKVVAKAEAEGKEPEPPDETKAQGCRYQTPPVLAKIIAAQKRAARATGVAFFDSLAAMGGTEMMDAFYHREHPIAYGDRVHFTGRGSAWWADLVLDEMLARYAHWANGKSDDKVASQGD